MSVTISFRLDDDQVAQLDEIARKEGANRGAYLRSVVSDLLTPQASLNVGRLNQVTEYSQAALAVIVANLLPEKQQEVIALTAERLEQFHGQK